MECQVCAHTQRAQIELSLANKVPLRVVSRRFSLSTASIHRHRHNHMPPQLVAQLLLKQPIQDVDLEKLRITESEGLLQNLVVQRARLWALADKADELCDINAATRVHGQLRGNLELTGKLLGDLQTGASNIVQNIVVLPAYHEMRTALVQALKPFPEARAAVARVLRDVEAEVVPAIQHG